MKRLIAVVLSISAFTAGCGSLPITVPDLPADQLLVNQATFENAVHQRIVGSCEAGRTPGTVSQDESLGKRVLCDNERKESGIR